MMDLILITMDTATIAISTRHRGQVSHASSHLIPGQSQMITSVSSLYGLPESKHVSKDDTGDGRQ